MRAPEVRRQVSPLIFQPCHYKVEFGKDKDGNILLGDEISPDGCRLWDSETLEMLDKELFREGKDDEVMEAYVEVYNRIIPDDEKVI